MDIVTTIAELLIIRKKFPTAPVLVPTMGALHDGHLSLFKKAREIAGPNGYVAVSIFVNPIQFDNPNDLMFYERNIAKDAELCKESGVDLLFTPDQENIYAIDHSTYIHENKLSNYLCGLKRPNHFDGVCTVVTKLFNLFAPIDAVFGKKDFQQLAIIRRMVRDLNFQIVVHAVETIRDEDGLALSSRNVRLTQSQRSEAREIRQALLLALKSYSSGVTDCDELLHRVREHLTYKAPNAEIDYLECVNSESLERQSLVNANSLLAIAVFFDEVRLIDNIELVQVD